MPLLEETMLIEVENIKKLNIVIFFIAILSAGITWILEIIFCVPNIILIWPVIFVIGLIGISEVNFDEQINIVFNEMDIVVIRNNKSVFLLYEDIIEAQRITNYGKQGTNEGCHRVRVVTKRKSWSLYTNRKEQENSMSFEETEIGDFYYRLKERGVKCC